MYDFETADGATNFRTQVVRLPRDYNLNPARVVTECGECTAQD